MTALAFHFLRVVNGVPVLRDGKTPAPPVGEWLVHEGEAVICSSGLHASYRALDALSYYEWEGGVCCLVEVDDVVVEQDDKLVCRRRRIVAMVECDELLRVFARQRALEVMHLWAPPPVVREYLETGNEEIRAAAWAAAWDAAWDAARDAAWAAAWAAARDAARAAARDAAWAAASAAARAAARDAARDAAWAAAWAAASDQLESMLLSEMGMEGAL